MFEFATIGISDEESTKYARSMSGESLLRAFENILFPYPQHILLAIKSTGFLINQSDFWLSLIEVST